MVENWRSSPGMPPLSRDVLSREVLESDGMGHVVYRVYVRGQFPHGKYIQGWTGHETVLIRETNGKVEKTIDYAVYKYNNPQFFEE